MDWGSRAYRSNQRMLILGVWLLFGLLLLGAIPLSHSLTTVAPVGETTSSSSNAPSVAPATGFPTPIQHVMVIYMENNATSLVLQHGPFEKQMWDTYANGGWSFYAECHPSAPNYVAITSGETRQCGSDSYTNYSGVTNIGGMAASAGLTWKAYAENMPSPCDTSNSGLYLVRHNPMAYYPGSSCKANDLPWSSWNVNSSTQANFIWITPNADDDAHNPSGGGLPTGDAWLKVFFNGGTDTNHSSQLKGWPGILNEPWFSSTVVFLTYDEGAHVNASAGYTVSGVTNSACSGGKSVCGGQIYLAAISPYTKGMGSYGADASHYNLMETIEWLLGLGCTGSGLDCNSGFPAMTSLFNFSTHVSAKYSVTGTVSNTTGAAISGAKIYANNSTASRSTTSSSSGSFSFSLANGSYDLTALASGYGAASQSVKVAGAALSGVDFSLSAVPGTPASHYAVNGSVFDSSTSGPIGNATLYANNTTSSLSTTSSASGNFSFRLSNGSYLLTALAPGYGNESQNVTVAGAALSGVDFALTAVPVNQTNQTRYDVNGSVRDFSTSDPIGNATLHANASQVRLVGTTSPNGSYRLLLSNGSYAITATAPGYQPDTVNLTVNGTTVTGLDFGLIPAGLSTFTTDGSVMSGTNGTPIENATIFFTNGPATISVETNSTGGYAVDLPNGTYNVTVVASGYVSSLSEVSVKGSTAADLNFTLTPVTATWQRSGGGGLDLTTPFYLSVIAGTFAAVGLSGWVLGRWVRRPGSRRRLFWRRRK